MFYQFKGNEEIAHSYIICRFGQCLLIDPSFDYEKIIEKLGPNQLQGILLTHAHHDHVALIQMFKVPIYIHEFDASLLFEDQYNGFSKLNPRQYKRKDLNLVMIQEDTKIPLADKFVQVIHTPGHTKGSVSFLYENYLFTGDTLFKESVGRHDLYSGNLFELKKSVLKIVDSIHPNTTIYPGHDDASTIRNERKMNPFYIKWKKQGKI